MPVGRSNSITESSTLLELLRERARDQPARIAYVYLSDDGVSKKLVTYAELDHRARTLATLLQDGAEPGARAVLLYPPGLEFIEAFFACIYAGIVAVPAYPPHPSHLSKTLPRFRHIVSNSQPSLILTTSGLKHVAQPLSLLASEFRGIRWLATDSQREDLADRWRDPNAGARSTAFIQYTSGTTRLPRGAMVSHANLLHNSGAIYRLAEHDASSVYVSWLPMYHDMGLIGGVLQPLYGGFLGVLMSPLSFLRSPIRWLRAISDYRGTTSPFPNFALGLCISKIGAEEMAGLDLSSWKVACNGSELIRPETLETFTKVFGPYGFRHETHYPAYGMAEATLLATGGKRSEPPKTISVSRKALLQHRVVEASGEADAGIRLVGCGQSLPDQKIIILDPDTSKLSAPGRVGEVCISGASVTQGYWNDTEDTKRHFLEQVSGTEGGPFLRTGDLGFLQGDELFITGRKQDLITLHGNHYYPQEIEWAAERSYPVIRPGCSAAFAVSLAGESQLVVVAEVERRHGPLDADLAMRNIRESVKSRVGVEIDAVLLLKAGSLPKTTSGKTQRYLCREMFSRDALPVVAEWRAEQPGKVAA